VSKNESLFRPRAEDDPRRGNSPVRAFRASAARPASSCAAKAAAFGTPTVASTGTSRLLGTARSGARGRGRRRRSAGGGGPRTFLSAPRPRPRARWPNCLRRLVRGLNRCGWSAQEPRATMSALRLARGFTGRPRIIKFEGCYHGHADSLLVKAGSARSLWAIRARAA